MGNSIYITIFKMSYVLIGTVDETAKTGDHYIESTQYLIFNKVVKVKNFSVNTINTHNFHTTQSFINMVLLSSLTNDL